MGKKSRGKRSSPRTEPPEEAVEDVEEVPEEPVDFKEEIADAHDELPEQPSEPPKIKKTLFIIGLALSALGLFGIMGLRTGLVQSLLGYSNPSPGVGPAESLAQITSMVPIVIGIFLIGVWGIKNDPIYRQLEKLKEAESVETADEESEDLQEEPFAEQDFDSAEEPEIEAKDNEFLPDQNEYAEDSETLMPEVTEAGEYAIEDSQLADDFTIENSPLPDELANEDAQLADELTMLADLELREEMLNRAPIMPDDKHRLREMIAAGVSEEVFMEELDKAMERRAKKEADHTISADEKASILEDELISELSELEENIKEDDVEDLEKKILKEIEDLENL